MININKLTPKDIGRLVIYDPGHQVPQRGYITSYNDKYVFVDYDNTKRGQATTPMYLSFVKK